MQITIHDGSTVDVDDARYATFQASAPIVATLLTGGVLTGAMPGGQLIGRDAGEALAFMVSQLAYTEGQLFERLYTPLQFRDFVPVVHEGGWADTIRYELVDYAGQGKRISGAASDIPMADAQFGERKFSVATGAIGYQYTQEELHKSAFFRTPLPTAKLTAAGMGAEKHLNQVALQGEASSGLTGLFNNPNVPQGNAPVGNWQAATVAQILTDFNTGLGNVESNTAYNDLPTDVLLPPAKFNYLATTMLSAANSSNDTILEFLKKKNLVTAKTGKPLNIKPAIGLSTAGVGGTNRMIAYVKREDRLKMHIPFELNFLAPQLVNLLVKVPGQYRYSGVEVRYPKSAYYMDGI